MDSFKVMSGLNFIEVTGVLMIFFYKRAVNRLEWLVMQDPHCEGQELPALQIMKSMEPNQIKG